MKTKLTYAQIASDPFLSGFSLLSNLALPPDEVCWLSKSLDVIQAEVRHYNKARTAIIKKYGEQTGEDDWKIDTTNPQTLKCVNADFETLHKRSFTITLVRKIKLPKKIEISAAQHNALRDAGLIEPLAFDEPKEDAPAEKTDGASEDRRNGEITPDGPPASNGELPKNRLKTRKRAEEKTSH
jgi:hypothetical protein